MARARGIMGGRLAPRRAGNGGDAGGAAQPATMALLVRPCRRATRQQVRPRARLMARCSRPITGTPCMRPRRLGVRFAPSLQSLPLNDVEITLIGSEPAFVRARELRLAQMESEATAEWRAAFDDLPPARQLQAIGLAARWGWHMQAIATAARQRLFNDYDVLYPRPFDFDVRTAARRTGLDVELIYAIIRQESLYEATAASSAGALGLMQLLPETARITARRAGLPAPTRSQLLQPAVNVPLGSHYLAASSNVLTARRRLRQQAITPVQTRCAAGCRSAPHGPGRLGGEHSLQRNPRLCAARRLALAGLPVAGRPQAAATCPVGRRGKSTARRKSRGRLQIDELLPLLQKAGDGGRRVVRQLQPHRGRFPVIQQQADGCATRSSTASSCSASKVANTAARLIASARRIQSIAAATRAARRSMLDGPRADVFRGGRSRQCPHWGRPAQKPRKHPHPGRHVAPGLARLEQLRAHMRRAVRQLVPVAGQDRREVWRFLRPRRKCLCNQVLESPWRRRCARPGALVDVCCNRAHDVKPPCPDGH